ncbi:endoribonuclease Dicer-like [Uloborus diversus]|uniref:endoribonuclease Dicer-like n=1 Tax=Uloborus diversus TaxID=327109 RepID=UPI00240A6927|nr:endoribonuclease Dicer-like [Uloborus diversus]
MTTHVLKPPKLRRYHILESISSKTFIPREYQVELLDCARRRNTVVCLGTGTGKTFVAVMLIKELSHQTRLPTAQGGKRTAFLVPTVPLLHQQAKFVSDCTDLSVGRHFGGEAGERDREAWAAEIERCQVLVATPDVFRGLLQHGLAPLSAFNLVVFDECHRAVGAHPYARIMRFFDACAPADRPRVLGLSAPLVDGGCRPEEMERRIRRLEATLRASVQTASELTALGKYGSRPRECLAEYGPPPDDGGATLDALARLDAALAFLDCVDLGAEAEAIPPHPCRRPRRYLIEMAHVVGSLGPWCAARAARLFVGEIDSVLPGAPTALHVRLLVLARTALATVEALCRRSEAEDVVEAAPPKLKELLKILERYRPPKADDGEGDGGGRQAECPPQGGDLPPSKADPKTARGPRRSERRAKFGGLSDDGRALCGLVFVRRRVTARLLSEWLRACAAARPEAAGFLSPGYIVGGGGPDAPRQEEVLQRFRTRGLNVVVATAVVEEGMDVPKCNLVVRFDPPESFRAYVQSKGRARVNDSLYVMMVRARDREAFAETLCGYKAMEELLLSRCHEADRDMEEPVEPDVDDLLPPYAPGGEGDGKARVTLSSAIALVNRYCAKLPSDTFTRLTPKWKIKEELSEGGTPSFQCILRLPINAPVKKPIMGPWMKKKQLAKMAAALKTCEELHKAGELDDNLLPTGKEAVRAEDREDASDEEARKEERGPARPGTTKRRLYYFKKVADALRDARPSPGQPCHLYVLDMRLTCPIPEEQNTRGRKIHDPSRTPRSFGILARRPIPPVCSFPVFTRSGEVTVSVRPALGPPLELDQEQLECLSYFHRYTFGEVLRLEKYPMTYRPEEAEASHYVVPVTQDPDGEDCAIDWAFAESILRQRDRRPGKTSDEERRRFRFRTEEYRDAVVMPWYRNLDKPQFFYVAEICGELTPASDFPDTEYASFEEYYLKKYDIAIVNRDQPLLDVDHTSARLNLLTPRYVNRKGVTLPTSSEHTKRTKRENLQQKQILVPELCAVHPFPAYLWRKAVCLPCILYRLNALLLAEQLRLQVADAIHVGMRTLPADFRWPPLDFGWTLADILGSGPATGEKKRRRPDPAPVRNGRAVTNGETHDSKCEDTNGVMDFEIDVFDPSKLDIPDDDALLERELEEINFGADGSPFDLGGSFPIGNGLPPFPLWRPPADGDGSRVRYGSPSNFEGSGWDSEWDVDEDETSFRSVNFHGLDYISAPGLIDMESLSNDLASCRDDDLWDSMDDDSATSDDEEAPDVPHKPFPVSEPAVDRTLSDAREEACESTWLTCPSMTNDRSTESDSAEEESDPEIVATVEEIKRKERQKIDFLYPDGTCGEAGDGSKIDEMLRIVAKSEEELLSEARPPDADGEPDATSPKAAPLDHPGEAVLAFGELLPNRERHLPLDDNLRRVAFDADPDLSLHPGPGPGVILQALTMSNANDGINLERLETVGDSFLKYAITVHLFCAHPDIHEGKLSYLRSKQISNFNLFRLGRRKGLGESMVASKFEPYDNWLPPGYVVPRGLEEALIASGGVWDLGRLDDLTRMSEEEVRRSVEGRPPPDPRALVPYNLLTQHSIPDKSIADCVEALIGAYLVSCGSRGALLFMSWLGLRVLPVEADGSYGRPRPPPPPSLAGSEAKLERLLAGYSAFERKIGYSFRDKSILLQAFTHASYHYNTLTDCYQRLEFLGDAVLDYLITRHLYEDAKRHSPGTLTDLRSALVNNTFFASLAVKYDFHKFFKAISPGLFAVVNKFVLLKEHNPNMEDYLQAYYIEEEECEEMEDVEVPKALGDIFESVAGAIYLDSGMSLDTVWRVYYTMMKPEIEYFSDHVPKSPIRELLELEPQTAKFERAEMTVSGKVRVCVDVFGKGQFVGVGRNKRIAKCTAAKHALRELKRAKKL